MKETGWKELFDAEASALVVSNSETELLTKEEMAVRRIQTIREQYALARTFPDFKEVRDVSEAFRVWAKSQRLGLEHQNDGAEMRLWSERQLGRWLDANVRHEGGNPQLSHHGTVGVIPEGINRNQSARWQRIQAIPEGEFTRYLQRQRERREEIKTADLLALWLEMEEARRKAERLAAAADAPASGDLFQLIHSPIADLAAHVPAGSVDAIVTDPPYPAKYLPVYSELTGFADHALKDGGSALVMVGQSYLPETLYRLEEALAYNWTVAYMTPGAEAVDLWDRRVATYWKPVLWFVKGKYRGEWRRDVVTSEARDKEHHDWGQSESGMEALIEGFTAPMETICDPFLGGGATAVAAVRLKRRFIGADIDASCIALSAARLRDG